MTDYDLQTGDVLYDRTTDVEWTIEMIEGDVLRFESEDVSWSVEQFEQLIENGEYEHRPIRADGGEESAETATVEIEGTAEELDELWMAMITRENKLAEYNGDHSAEMRYVSDVGLEIHRAMDELDDTTEEI